MKTIGLILSVAFLGVFLQFSGASLNVFVMNHNTGRMPVWCFTQSIGISIFTNPARYTFMGHDTYWNILGDIIPVPTPSPDFTVTPAMASIGDMMIFSGNILWALSYPLPFFYFGKWLRRRRQFRMKLKFIRKWFLRQLSLCLRRKR